MLARLILALLLAVFAVPAVAPAACHESRGEHAATMDMPGGMSMVMPKPGKTGDAVPDQGPIPAHGCIGCVPPSSWTGTRIAGVMPREGADLVERAAVLDLGADVAPRLRPPRKA